MSLLRWDPCLIQEGTDFDTFLSHYINRPERRCLIIGGAGFDPRATILPKKFSRVLQCKQVGLFFREERILDQPLLRACADNNESIIASFIPNSTFPSIAIFAEEVTAVGGRRAILAMDSFDLTNFTDIFVDISALSCGVFFSIVSYLISIFDSLSGRFPNIHLIAAEQPRFDHRIRGVPADTVSLLHGFKGERSLDGSDNVALLWIPTLSVGHRDSLVKIYQFIHRTDSPIDVCPIIPFPGHNPRLPDLLIAEYREQLPTWRVDHRDFLYSAEGDPLDSYRTISTLVESRAKLFRDLGGSQVVLSPLGNKMMSVGAMLAAIEKKLPVAMVESIGYDDNLSTEAVCDETALKHVWLCGEAYSP